MLLQCTESLYGQNLETFRKASAGGEQVCLKEEA